MQYTIRSNAKLYQSLTATLYRHTSGFFCKNCEHKARSNYLNRAISIPVYGALGSIGLIETAARSSLLLGVKLVHFAIPVSYSEQFTKKVFRPLFIHTYYTVTRTAYCFTNLFFHPMGKSKLEQREAHEKIQGYVVKFFGSFPFKFFMKIHINGRRTSPKKPKAANRLAPSPNPLK